MIVAEMAPCAGSAFSSLLVPNAIGMKDCEGKRRGAHFSTSSALPDGLLALVLHANRLTACSQERQNCRTEPHFLQTPRLL